MNAYELADELKRCIDDGSTDLVCVYGAVNMLRQQADRIAELEKEADRLSNHADELRKVHADRIAELEFENKAFRDELFKRGSMDSCSQAAALHGFVSPRQAGDDAREYIANVLKKASEK